MAELRAKTLEDLLELQNGEISALQKHLDDAKRQVQEIAVHAIYGHWGPRPWLTSTR